MLLDFFVYIGSNIIITNLLCIFDRLSRCNPGHTSVTIIVRLTGSPLGDICISQA